MCLMLSMKEDYTKYLYKDGDNIELTLVSTVIDNKENV